MLVAIFNSNVNVAITTNKIRRFSFGGSSFTGLLFSIIKLYKVPAVFSVWLGGFGAVLF